MYICDMCKEPIAVGTQYVNAFDKNICLDCAVRNSLDDVMAVFGITYTEAPDEIVAEGVIVYDNTDSVVTPEKVENFFHSENPVFSPTQVGEKMEKNAEYGMTELNPYAFILKDEEVKKDLVTMTRDEFVEKYQYANTGDGDEDTPSNLLGKEVAGEYYDDWHKEMTDEEDKPVFGRAIEYKNAIEDSWTPEDMEEWRKKEVEMTAYIRQCDTMEQFLEKYPGMEEYWEAEVEGK